MNEVQAGEEHHRQTITEWTSSARYLCFHSRPASWAQDLLHYPFRGNRADLDSIMAVADEVILPGPGYSVEECDRWISNLLASDADSSGGVSRVEYTRS